MEIAGLPMHPLVIHAAVLLTPLAVLSAVVFAVVPKWRYLSRWPTALLTLGAFGAIWVSRLSGPWLVDSRPELGALVRTHEERGEQLSLIMTAFTVLVLVAVWALAGVSGFASGVGTRESRIVVLDRVLPAVVVLVALLVLVWLVLTGDSGARAVWG